jgi:hypothetical protein
MNPVSRPAPRFVPTLTEVVDPGTLGNLVPKTRVDEVQAVVDLVLRQLQPIFEQRLEEEFDRLVRATLANQWAELRERLHADLEISVRQVVAATLDAQNWVKNSK